MENDRTTNGFSSDDETSGHRARAGRRTRVVSIVAGSGLALGLVGAGVAGAASSSSPAHTSTNVPGGPGGPGGPGAPGMMRGSQGTISAVGTASVTITEFDGTTATFATTSSTTYSKDGTTVASSTLAVGDTVAIFTSSPTSTTATAVAITSPSLRGTVVSVSGGTITIKDGSGFYRTIHTSGSTTFLNGGATSTIASVTTGENVLAVGSVDADHTSLDATTVGVILPRTTGRVKSVSGSTFTMTVMGGTTLTVTETASTAYRSGQSTATSAIVKVGAFVSVEGTKDSAGTLTATSVNVIPPPPSAALPGLGGLRLSAPGGGVPGPGGPGAGGPGAGSPGGAGF